MTMDAPRHTIQPDALFALYFQNPQRLNQFHNPATRTQARSEFSQTVQGISQHDRITLFGKIIHDFGIPQIEMSAQDFTARRDAGLEMLQALSTSFITENEKGKKKERGALATPKIADTLLEIYTTAVRTHNTSDVDATTQYLIEAGMTLIPVFMQGERREKALRREKIYETWVKKIRSLPLKDRSYVIEVFEGLMASFPEIPPPNITNS